MLKKITVILLLLLMPMLLYAETDVALVESMIANLNVNNSKNVIISGTHGSLHIFFEKKAKKTLNSDIFLVYNGIDLKFKITGNTLAVTQDGKVVFAVNGGNVYAKATSGCKEKLSIKYKDVKYIYDDNNITISHQKETFKFNEIMYNKDQNFLKVYNNGKYVKTVKIQN